MGRPCVNPVTGMEDLGSAGGYAHGGVIDISPGGSMQSGLGALVTTDYGDEMGASDAHLCDSSRGLSWCHSLGRCIDRATTFCPPPRAAFRGALTQPPGAVENAIVGMAGDEETGMQQVQSITAEGLDVDEEGRDEFSSTVLPLAPSDWSYWNRVNSQYQRMVHTTSDLQHNSFMEDDHVNHQGVDAFGCRPLLGETWCAPQRRCINPVAQVDGCPLGDGPLVYDAHGCLRSSMQAWCDPLSTCIHFLKCPTQFYQLGAHQWDSPASVDVFGCVNAHGFYYCEKKMRCVAAGFESCENDGSDGEVDTSQYDLDPYGCDRSRGFVYCAGKLGGACYDPVQETCASSPFDASEGDNDNMDTIPYGLSPMVNKATVHRNTMLDEFGCRVTMGEQWCIHLSRCIQPWLLACPTKIVDGQLVDHTGCKTSLGESWCKAKNKCVKYYEEECQIPELPPEIPPMLKVPSFDYLLLPTKQTNKKKLAPWPNHDQYGRDIYGCKYTIGERWCPMTTKCHPNATVPSLACPPIPKEKEKDYVFDKRGCLISHGFHYCSARSVQRCLFSAIEICPGPEQEAARAGGNQLMDEYGCNRYAGHVYCKSTGRCHVLREVANACPDLLYVGLNSKGKDKTLCPKDSVWCSSSKQCTNVITELCLPSMEYDTPDGKPLPDPDQCARQHTGDKQPLVWCDDPNVKACVPPSMPCSAFILPGTQHRVDENGCNIDPYPQPTVYCSFLKSCIGKSDWCPDTMFQGLQLPDTYSIGSIAPKRRVMDDYGCPLFSGKTFCPFRHACISRDVLCIPPHLHLNSLNTSYAILHDRIVDVDSLSSISPKSNQTIRDKNGCFSYHGYDYVYREKFCPSAKKCIPISHMTCSPKLGAIPRYDIGNCDLNRHYMYCPANQRCEPVFSSDVTSYSSDASHVIINTQGCPSWISHEDGSDEGPRLYADLMANNMPPLNWDVVTSLEASNIEVSMEAIQPAQKGDLSETTAHAEMG
eukprot:Nk52_evm1s348 gene=Nk52_evmTU1s348